MIATKAPHRVLQALAVLAIVASASAACGRHSEKSIPAGAGPTADFVSSKRGTSAKVSLVRTFADTITGITSSPKTGSLLVATRGGIVYRLPHLEASDWQGFGDAQKVLDISSLTTTVGERGLLNVLYSPDGDHVFVVFTSAAGTVTLRTYRDHEARLELVGDVVKIDHPYAGHNGGGLAIAGDDSLMLSVGDMATSRPPLAQQDDNLFGKIIAIPLKVAVRGELVTSDQLKRWVIAKGLRNPWRISVDRNSDSLWIADVGETSIEEVDRLHLDGTATDRINFGWPYFEGDIAFVEGPPEDFAYTSPLLARPHDEHSCAITGGVVYRGKLIPGLSDHYIFGDSCEDHVVAAKVNGADAMSDQVDVASIGEGITTIGTTRDGEILLGGMAGGLYRLDPADWRGVSDDRGTVGKLVAPDTTKPTLPSELCEVPRLLASLAPVTSAPKEEAKRLIQDALAKIKTALTVSPASFADDLSTIQSTLTQAQVVADEADWDMANPLFSDLVHELSTGTGRGKDFGSAITDVASRVKDSCPA